MKHTIVKNSILNVVFSLSNGFLGLLLLPFMTVKLGKLDYGLYALLILFSGSGYVQILELGLQSSVTKFTAQFFARGELYKIKTLLSTVFINFLGLALISFVIGNSVRGPLVRLLNIPLDRQDLAMLCLSITFGNYFFTLPNLAVTGVLQGYRHFSYLRSSEFFINLLRSVLIVLNLIYWPDLFTLLIINFATSFLQLLVNLAIVYVKCDGIYPSPASFTWSIITEIRSMTLWIFVGRVCSTLFKQTDRLFISILLGPAAVTEYELFTKVPYVLKSIFGQVNEIIMPTSSHLNESKDRERTLKTLFYKSTRWQMFISLPVYSILICYAAEFLGGWAGPQSIYLSTPFILAVVMSMTLVFSGGTSMLLGANLRMREMSLLTIIAAIINVGATYIFLQEFGLSGAIFGSLVGIGLQLPLSFYYFAKEFKISVFQILREYLYYLGLGVAAFAFKFYFLNDLFTKTALTNAVCAAILLCVLYLAAFFFILDEEDRMIIHNLKKRFVA